MLGSGVVGEAVQDLIFSGALRGKCGRDLELVKVFTRSPAGKKWHASRPSLFTTRPEEVVDHPDVEIVLEVLGYQDERSLASFRDYIIRAFEQGKSVVTSDKAVLARFGKDIWPAAARCGAELRFEACVGGGIPVIRSLTESLSAEEPESIYGIVNGTCNYILSEMKRAGKSFSAALREAQERGYAETNPEADISGRDAEAKLILLAAVTFGLVVDPGEIHRKGIDGIHPIDFAYAERKGSCTIKHLAVAGNRDGRIGAFVSPVLVPRRHFSAGIDGSTNAIFFKGKRSGAGDGRDWNYLFMGPGAGGGPTAVAVMGDVLELARGGKGPRCIFPDRNEAVPALQPEAEISAPFYVRFIVRDKIGIVAEICEIMGSQGIHVSEVWQLRHSEEELEALVDHYRLSAGPGQILPFVITLEEATVGQIENAMKMIRRKDFILVEPVWMPIWGGGKN
jgi:homoserine dehydrogenase